jgi:hypothetical protein
MNRNYQAPPSANRVEQVSMLRFLKKLGWAGMLVFGIQSAYSFSLLGPPNEGWQTPEIGYMLTGDIGTPKVFGEEYRWNTPVVYYAFDDTFLNYFGSNGIVAIDQAFAILNALTNTPFSGIDLNQFPQEAFRYNAKAQSLGLFDLKTETLRILLEQLGLAEPDRYVWTLRHRETQPGASCPFMIYWVIMRNYDPFTFEPSAYVNGVLYSYTITEICSGDPPLAVTVNTPVDPTAPTGTALTSRNGGGFGSYTVGLSRDDVGGLRYLLRTNNVNWESPSFDSTEYVTNTSQAQLLFGSNITSLAYLAPTTDPATLGAAYPGLVISSTSNYFVNTWVTNITPYFTNFPYDPLGTAPHLVFATNREFTIQTRYLHTFANLFTFTFTNGAWASVPVSTAPTNLTRTTVTLQTISSKNPPYLPVDSSNTVTTVKLEKFKTNMIVGEYFILPTNSCSIAILGLQAILTNHYTNFLVSVTNTVVDTNTFGGGSTNFFEQSLITWSTNHVFVYYPVECGTTNSSLRQGMDTMAFYRASFDSLVGRFFQPITNTYHLTSITNSKAYTSSFQRVITRPDFSFGALDLGDLLLTRTGTEGTFIPSVTASNAAGPGHIEPGRDIGFNKISPMLINTYNPGTVNGGLTEFSASQFFAWGSYDGSTNDPVVYPSGTSLRDLENMILFSIVTTELPAGAVGVGYMDNSGTNGPVVVQLQAAGGQLSYTWAPTTDSSPLPPGLVLNADGTIQGTPTAEGTYPFTVSVTEAGARVSVRKFTITVTPP